MTVFTANDCDQIAKGGGEHGVIAFVESLRLLRTHATQRLTQRSAISTAGNRQLTWTGVDPFRSPRSRFSLHVLSIMRVACTSQRKSLLFKGDPCILKGNRSIRERGSSSPTLRAGESVELNIGTNRRAGRFQPWFCRHRCPETTAIDNTRDLMSE